MPGIQPTVETVVRRCVTPRSGRRRLAPSTASRFIIGSPMPMNTRWSTSSMRRKCSAWSRISEAVRLRPYFIAPVAQNVQVSGQPRLRGDAQRAPPVAVAHEHRLDGAPVVRVKQRLQRAVAGLRLVDDGQRRERDLLGQRVAQRDRQVRHRLVAAGAARGPVPHLAGAEGWLAGVCERALEQVEIHAIHRRARSRRARAARGQLEVVELKDGVAGGRQHRHAAGGEVVRAPRVEVAGHGHPRAGVGIDGRRALVHVGDRLAHERDPPAQRVLVAHPRRQRRRAQAVVGQRLEHHDERLRVAGEVLHRVDRTDVEDAAAQPDAANGPVGGDRRREVAGERHGRRGVGRKEALDRDVEFVLGGPAGRPARRARRRSRAAAARNASSPGGRG